MLKLVKGSPEWFDLILKLLGNKLMGIEVHDDRQTGRQVMPWYQLYFIVHIELWHNGDLPKGLGDVPGFRSIYSPIRGKNQTVAAILFDFDEGNTEFYPDLSCHKRVNRLWPATFSTILD